MGIGHKNLWLTNTGDESGRVYLSAFIPVKKEDGYHWPPNTPLGGDYWVNNTIDLKEEEGPVYVEIVKSDVDTGIWIICADEYFGAEQWLYNFKPRFKESSPDQYGWKIDHKYSEEMENEDPNNDSFGLHVRTLINMDSGDGPWPVTFIRTTKEEFEKKCEEHYNNWLKSVREKRKNENKLIKLFRKIFRK